MIDGRTWLALDLLETNIWAMQCSNRLPQYHGFSLPAKYCSRVSQGSPLARSYPALLLVEHVEIVDGFDIIIPGWSMALYLLHQFDPELAKKFPHFTNDLEVVLALVKLGEDHKLWRRVYGVW